MKTQPGHSAVTDRVPRPWRSLRTRLTFIASLAITLAVVAGLILLYLLQIKAVHRALDNQLRAYATQIAHSAPNATWPSVLAASDIDANAEAQVIDMDGTVLAASRDLVGQPALYALPAGSRAPIRLKAADGVLHGEIRVVATLHTVAARRVIIVVSTSTEQLTSLRWAFTSRLLLGLPFILLTSYLGVWLIVGRALRPVERLRQAVTDITSDDLSRRVPEPGTADEIGHLAQTMNTMLARLEHSAQRQTRFVADASHELRSPLAAIRTTLDVGLAHPDRAPWPVLARRASEQATRLEDLIQQLLLLAHTDEKRLTGHRQPIDLQHLLNELAAAATTSRVTIRLQADGPSVTLGHVEHLSRLFSNVLDNAIRYATEAVIVRITTSGERIVVEITDDGPGIPEEDRERIFDRFVRLDPSRDRTKGTTGLGLAIAREIAVAHHGSISAGGSGPGGAKIIVDLPSSSSVQILAVDLVGDAKSSP